MPSQLDDLKWGNLEISRFTFHQVWENVKPFRLLLRTAAKGDGVGARKHLAGIMHHRDPLRNAMFILGLYFAYQFLREHTVDATLLYVLRSVSDSLICIAGAS